MTLEGFSVRQSSEQLFRRFAGSENKMFSYDQAKPALLSIQLACSLGVFPISLNVHSGKVYSNSSLIAKTIANFFFACLTLKVLQVFYALAALLSHFNSKDLPSVILTCTVFSLTSTSLFWGYEMLCRAKAETIILFNEVKYAKHPVDVASLVGKGDGSGQRAKLERNLKKIMGWCLSLKTLRLQELLCVLTPFSLKVFVPTYLLHLILFPSWPAFSTSLFHYGSEDWKWEWGLCILFELIVAFCVESYVMLNFYLELALQSCHLDQLRHHVEDQS